VKQVFIALCQHLGNVFSNESKTIISLDLETFLEVLIVLYIYAEETGYRYISCRMQNQCYVGKGMPDRCCRK